MMNGLYEASFLLKLMNICFLIRMGNFTIIVNHFKYFLPAKHHQNCRAYCRRLYYTDTNCFPPTNYRQYSWLHAVVRSDKLQDAHQKAL